MGYSEGPPFTTLLFDRFLSALDGDFCTSEGGDPSQYGKPQASVEIYHNNHVFIEDCGTVNRTNVVSISYYQTEFSFGSGFAQRQCMEYGKV